MRGLTAAHYFYMIRVTDCDILQFRECQIFTPRRAACGVPPRPARGVRPFFIVGGDNIEN